MTLLLFCCGYWFCSRHGWNTGIICSDPLLWCNLNCVLLLFESSLWSDTAFHRMKKKTLEYAYLLRNGWKMVVQPLNSWSELSHMCHTVVWNMHIPFQRILSHLSVSSVFGSGPLFEASFQLLGSLYYDTLGHNFKLSHIPNKIQNAKLILWLIWARMHRNHMQGGNRFKRGLDIGIVNRICRRRVIEYQRTRTHARTHTWI